MTFNSWGVLGSQPLSFFSWGINPQHTFVPMTDVEILDIRSLFTRNVAARSQVNRVINTRSPIEKTITLRSRLYG